MRYKHLFGPVKSRRLGLSLGVDLLPYKTCTLDCIYCECGATTKLTTKRKVYRSTEEIIAELSNFLSSKPQLDQITFSGAGEPTLAINISEIISHLKKEYPQYSVTVITNGTLLGEPQVRAAIVKADIVIPSLDAVTKDLFQKINRPHKSISIDEIIDGLVAFRKEFKGKLWLEIFVIPGLNDQPKDIEHLKKVVAKITPDKIQINTLDRSGVLENLRPATNVELNDFADILGFKPVDIILGRSRNIADKDVRYAK